MPPPVDVLPSVQSAERDARITQVVDLHYRRVPVSVMAQVLGVGVGTVEADLKEGRLRVVEDARLRAEPFELYADACYVFEFLRAEALVFLAENPRGLLRLHAIRVAADLQARLVGLQQDVGLLPRSLGVLSVERGEREALEGLRRLSLTDVLTKYEEITGPFTAEERQRIMDLDQGVPRLSRPESGGLPGAHIAIRGPLGRLLPPGEPGAVAGEPDGGKVPRPDGPDPG